MMTVDQLASSICKDIVRSVHNVGQRSFIVTNFHYPTGDTINLYLEDRNGETWLSDFGTTCFNFRVNGIDMSESRRSFIDAICNTSGLVFDSQILRRRLSDTPALDCIQFCEGLVRLSTIEYDYTPRTGSPFPAQVEKLINQRVTPKRPVVRNWFNLTIDHNRSFPVDYRIGEKKTERHVYQVTSGEKSTMVVAVCNFLKSHKASVRSLAIVDPEIELTDHQIDRLQLSLSELEWGVEGHEEKIVDFALAE